MIRNTTSNWGSVARAFHWILGLTIIGMLAFGWWMNHIPARPDRFFYRSIHADIGYLLLALMVLRLVWRWINPVPAMPAETPKWERIAARAGHFALYAVVFLAIMLGWEKLRPAKLRFVPGALLAVVALTAIVYVVPWPPPLPKPPLLLPQPESAAVATMPPSASRSRQII